MPTLKFKKITSFVDSDGKAATRQPSPLTVEYEEYGEGTLTWLAGDDSEQDIPIPDGMDVITHLEITYISGAEDEGLLYELNFDADIEIGVGGGVSHTSKPTSDIPLFGCGLFPDVTPSETMVVGYRVFGAVAL